MIKITLKLLTAIASVFVAADSIVDSASAQTPILEYGFNETGTSAQSSGSNSTALGFFNSSGAATDLHSNGGVGVSGGLNDRAFDNTASTGMGSAAVGGRGNIPATTFGSLASFTLQCWFNASSIPANGTRLFDDNKIAVTSSSSGGTFFLYVNSLNVGASSLAYSQINQWIFFAVSYDGTLTSNNVAFYTGTKTTSVTQVGTSGTLNAGSVINNHALGIGNLSTEQSGTRPFDGYLDDVRLFGNASNNSGVLTQQQLETFRLSDVTVVPEPSVIIFNLFGLLGLIWISSERKKRRYLISG